MNFRTGQLTRRAFVGGTLSASACAAARADAEVSGGGPARTPPFAATHDCDVLVAGGGPAGIATAVAAARAGA